MTSTTRTERPSYTGDTVVRCFAGSHNGLLFRIVNSDEYRWAFYNDTTSYHITVRVSFGGLSKVEPLGRTVMHRNRAATTFDFEVLVAPGATEMFMEGEPNGFQISYVAQRYSRKLKILLEPVMVEAPPPPPSAYRDSCLSGSEDDARGVPRRASSDVMYSPAASVGF